MWDAIHAGSLNQLYEFLALVFGQVVAPVLYYEIVDLFCLLRSVRHILRLEHVYQLRQLWYFLFVHL